MSGGVDSSVAAYLLKEAGYQVIGVTMELMPEEDPFLQSENAGCCGLTAAKDAGRVASQIGIPHYVFNLRKEFDEHVIAYFVRSYQEGRTPNPCIECNRHLKWGALLQRGLQIGADYVATGHYARVIRCENGRYALKTAEDGHKDQTYALYQLSQEQLSRTLMPLGEYSKEDVRRIALELGLITAKKPESQEICFVPDGDYASFIERREGAASPHGNFVDESGAVLGEHKGIIRYTVGQRKGLGISFGEPRYVLSVDPENNEVVLGANEDLMKKEVYASSVCFMGIPDLSEPVRAFAKIRYNHRAAPCLIKKTGNDEICAIFDEPQRAATPGQALVVYCDSVLLCGGTIK